MKKKEEKKALFEPGTGKSIKRRLIASKAFYSGQLERLRQQSLERGASPWKMLVYQRVIEVERHPLPLTLDSYITPKTFDQQMQYLARECRPIRLAELCSLIEENEPIPDKTVVVTLDCGHMDNYLNAFPVLLKYQIPATLFLPTGYIGTNLYFFEHRLVLSLIAFAQAGLGAPYFEVLGKSFYENLAKISPDKKVTPEVTRLIVEAFRFVSLADRAKSMLQLGEAVAEAGGLPDFEDFVRWDDVRHMAEKGLDFGSMGHFAVSNPGLSGEQFMQDLDQSYKLLVEQKLQPQKVYSFAPGVRSDATMEALRLVKCRFATDRIPFIEPRFQAGLPMVLGRTSMFEACSFCLELFAARLWQLEISGVQY